MDLKRNCRLRLRCPLPLSAAILFPAVLETQASSGGDCLPVSLIRLLSDFGPPLTDIFCQGAQRSAADGLASFRQRGQNKYSQGISNP